MEPWGNLSDGTPVARVRIGSDALTATLSTRGAALVDLRLAGHSEALVLGSPDLSPYEGAMGYFGAVVGPVANRIADARAWIDGQLCTFDANEGERTTLHGGDAGTAEAVWEIVDAGEDAATFGLTLRDGHGGFPGNRRIVARYHAAGRALNLTLTATTDAPTLMSLASHGYWRPGPGPTWAGQRLWIAADRYLPVDDRMIPTGQIAAVEGTGFDFRAGRELGSGTVALDHNFCLAAGDRPLTPVLWLSSPEGPTLEVATTAPGVQVFDMRTVSTGDAPTLHDHPYRGANGIAIEPQAWPDAPGRDDWPEIGLAPGQTYRQATRFALT